MIIDLIDTCLFKWLIMSLKKCAITRIYTEKRKVCHTHKPLISLSTNVWIMFVISLRWTKFQWSGNGIEIVIELVILQILQTAFFFFVRLTRIFFRIDFSVSIFVLKLFLFCVIATFLSIEFADIFQKMSFWFLPVMISSQLIDWIWHRFWLLNMNTDPAKISRNAGNSNESICE